MPSVFFLIYMNISYIGYMYICIFNIHIIYTHRYYNITVVEIAIIYYYGYLCLLTCLFTVETFQGKERASIDDTGPYFLNSMKYEGTATIFLMDCFKHLDHRQIVWPNTCPSALSHLRRPLPLNQPLVPIYACAVQKPNDLVLCQHADTAT